MNMLYSSLSKCGKRRNNEDAFQVVFYPEESRWMGIVCDGIGGQPLGEVASATIVESICRYYETHRNEPDICSILKAACCQACEDLNRKADLFSQAEMGTTMVMACLDHDILTIAHLGDSRCYVTNHKGKLTHITHDHTHLSFGWEVLSKCFIAYQDTPFEPEIKQLRVTQGCRVLLCSDGLYKSMPPEILLARINEDKRPEEILDVLDFLCEKNGDDNYTAILATL